MFSLIITIISIALVAVTTAATVSYLGTTWVKQSANSAALQIINHSNQISAAILLSKYFGDDLTPLLRNTGTDKRLVPGGPGCVSDNTQICVPSSMLGRIPKAPDGVTDGNYYIDRDGYVFVELDAENPKALAVCEEINAYAGVEQPTSGPGSLNVNRVKSEYNFGCARQNNNTRLILFRP